jgi:hypothetical protein
MNSTKFDSLTASLSFRLGRRAGIGLLAVMGLHELVPYREAQAKKQCPPCRKKKRGKCKKKLTDGTPCGTGGQCQGGACVGAAPAPLSPAPDYNVCTLSCGIGEHQPCGPAGSSCVCVNRGEGVGACVKLPQGASCDGSPCAAGEICGIPCTTYLPYCWQPCV